MNLIGYHGTPTISSDKILKNGFKIYNKKKHLWLGKGIYFFTEDIYAFKWILDLYKQDVKSIDYTDMIKTMSLLKANIGIEEDRLLDLSTFKGKHLFDKTYNKMKEINAEKITQILNSKYVKCFVIEYMFNELGFDKIYDAVKEIYRINIRNYKDILHDNERGVPQCQICVKKIDIIKDVEKIDYEDKIEDYIQSWNELIGTKSLVKIENSENNMYKSFSNTDNYI